MIKWLRSDFENQRLYEIIFALAAGCLIGFVVGGISSDWVIVAGANWWDVMTAFGTVGAVIVALLTIKAQGAQAGKQKRKEALKALAEKYHKVELIRREFIGRKTSVFNGPRAVRRAQRKVVEILDPRHDLVDKNFNLLIDECGRLLAKAEVSSDEGANIGGTLEHIDRKLLAARHICIRCWHDLGYYWIGDDFFGSKSLHEVPPKDLTIL